MADDERREPEGGGDPAPPVLSARCRHLRTKKMFVHDDVYADPEDADEDDAIYWCMKNQMKNFGPDDEHVNGRDCRDPNRTCHEPL